jgi:hypothetical protein
LDLDSIGKQQAHLGVYYSVFSAPLLIPIVNHQHFHAVL